MLKDLVRYQMTISPRLVNTSISMSYCPIALPLLVIFDASLPRILESGDNIYNFDPPL